jgi:hypothetical protein
MLEEDFDMKRFVALLALLVFVFAVGTVFAKDPNPEKQIEPKIRCCFQDGQCLETRKDNCALKKGIVVGDCKDCPGAWGKGQK